MPFLLAIARVYREMNILRQIWDTRVKSEVTKFDVNEVRLRSP